MEEETFEEEQTLESEQTLEEEKVMEEDKVMKEETFEEEKTLEEDPEAKEEDFKEENPDEKTMEVVELEAEKLEKCEAVDGKVVCKAGEYIVYSIDNKLYASKMETPEDRTEVNMEMTFGIQTIKTGGVIEGEPSELATVKVAFAEEFITKCEEVEKLAEEKVELEAKVDKLQAKLNAYKCSELSNKFAEICFDVNLSVAEKSEWKNRINKNEFASEDELIEKFGGYVFKKNMENKYSAYTAEVITEKVNNKKSYEELIDQYMTDK